MLAIERRSAILSKLVVEGKVLVSDLSREFGVTEETIRRDLEKLDNDGLVHKTYGGAVKADNINLDLPFQVRKQKNVENKQRIAAVIAEMIDDGAYLMLDSSTTALCVIQHIINKKNITIITNSVEILIELCNKPDWTVISTGGTLKEGGLALVGYQTEKMLAGFHVDMAICSCKGIDENVGITDSNERDSAIKPLMRPIHIFILTKLRCSARLQPSVMAAAVAASAFFTLCSPGTCSVTWVNFRSR